jgi:hypothetical protein
MKGRARIAASAAVAASSLLLVALLVSKTEAGAGKPSTNVPLVASFRQAVTDPAPADRILGDDKGPYVNGVESAGIVQVNMVKPSRDASTYFSMTIDNEGDGTLGRSVDLLFHEYGYSCTVDGRPDSTSYMDFAIGGGTPVVRTKWIYCRTWRAFVLDEVSGKYYESLEILDLASLALNEIAYVGMSCNFRALLADGTVTDEYYMGYMWDPVEVQALAVDANGRPVRWAIRPIQDPAVYGNIQQNLDNPASVKPYVPARMLLQLHYPVGQKKPVGYQSQCYGIWYMPFELVLDRM